MRIVNLTEDTKKNILEDLLKRSPNNYGEYEKIENINNVHGYEIEAYCIDEANQNYNAKIR